MDGNDANHFASLEQYFSTLKMQEYLGHIISDNRKDEKPDPDVVQIMYGICEDIYTHSSVNEIQSNFSSLLHDSKNKSSLYLNAGSNIKMAVDRLVFSGALDAIKKYTLLCKRLLEVSSVKYVADRLKPQHHKGSMFMNSVYGVDTNGVKKLGDGYMSDAESLFKDGDGFYMIRIAIEGKGNIEQYELQLKSFLKGVNILTQEHDDTKLFSDISKKDVKYISNNRGSLVATTYNKNLEVAEVYIALDPKLVKPVMSIVSSQELFIENIDENKVSMPLYKRFINVLQANYIKDQKKKKVFLDEMQNKQITFDIREKFMNENDITINDRADIGNRSSNNTVGDNSSSVVNQLTPNVTSASEAVKSNNRFSNEVEGITRDYAGYRSDDHVAVLTRSHSDIRGSNKQNDLIVYADVEEARDKKASSESLQSRAGSMSQEKNARVISYGKNKQSPMISNTTPNEGRGRDK